LLYNLLSEFCIKQIEYRIIACEFKVTLWEIHIQLS
jgi:hypothetical protein